MDVIAAKIKNPKNRELHWDFIRETCISFGVDLYEKDQVILPQPKNTIVTLSHETGIALPDFDFNGINTILVGCDDSSNDWMTGFRSVRVPTPVNYFLWSGVALGIALYARYQLSSAQ